MASLVLKRASASRPSGEWSEEDFDVLEDGAVVGRIFKVNAAPIGSPWMWTLAFGHHEDSTTFFVTETPAQHSRCIGLHGPDTSRRIRF